MEKQINLISNLHAGAEISLGEKSYLISVSAHYCFGWDVACSEEGEVAWTKDFKDALQVVESREGVDIIDIKYPGDYRRLH